ncbi:MAG: MCP four helix bundle domain-containing protein, partial [Pseudomonadaceae bacterium]
MLSKFKIGTRLIIAFILVASISAIVGLVGLSNSSTMNDLADALYDRELMGLSYIKEANINLIYIGRARSNFLLATNQSERDRIRAEIDRYSESARENVDAARALFATERSLELFREVDATWADYQSTMAQALQTASQQDFYLENPELQRQLGQVRERGDKLDQIMTELSRGKESNAKQANADANALYQS